MRPPGYEGVESWDALSPWLQAKLLAYYMICQYEEDERFELMIKASAGGRVQ